MHLSPSPALPMPRAWAAAIVLIVLAILGALSHHPVAGHHPEVRDTFVQMTQMQSEARLVHGGLTALLGVLAAAMAMFGRVLGERRAAVSAALAAYCLGCVLLGIAMLFDGFITARLAQRFAAAAALETQVGGALLALVGAVVQVFSKAGLIAQSLAMLAWSYAAARHPALPGGRVLAALGLAAALPPLALLLLGGLELRPSSLMAIFAAHALWYLAAAWQLYRLGRQPAQVAALAQQR